MRRLVIVGAGGHALEVASLISRIEAGGSPVGLVGHLVEPEYLDSATALNSRVLGGLEWLAEHPGVEVVVAVGSPRGRAAIVRRIEDLGGVEFATLVDPAASVEAGADLGSGTQVLAGAIVGARAALGSHCIVNYGAMVTHEGVLGDYSTIGPGACLGGKVKLGEGVDVGMNASVLPRVELGEWSRVGAGAVVIRAVAPHATVVGVPALPV